MLPKQAIIEYQEIHKRECGEEISYEKALEKGIKLIKLFQIIYRPIPKFSKQDEEEGEQS